MFDHRTTITVTPVVGKDVIGHATDIFGKVAHQVASLQDRVVREQLIAAGWTPPEARKQDEQIIRQMLEAAIAIYPHLNGLAVASDKALALLQQQIAAISAARARLPPTPPEGGQL